MENNSKNLAAQLAAGGIHTGNSSLNEPVKFDPAAPGEIVKRHGYVDYQTRRVDLPARERRDWKAAYFTMRGYFFVAMLLLVMATSVVFFK